MAANECLRRLLAEADWNNSAAARAVNATAAASGVTLRTNNSNFTHWLSGVRPHPDTVGYLAEALTRRLQRPVLPADLGYPLPTPIDTPGDPLAAIAELGQHDVDRRDLLARTLFSTAALTGILGPETTPRTDHAARTGRAVGAADVAAIEGALRAFDDIDERFGGGFGREAVTTFLSRDVAALCRAATGTHRQGIYAVATELAYLAGWKHHDLRREGAAQAWYLQAHALSGELDNPAPRAYVMRILAHQAFDLGATAGCLDLAERSAALAKGHVDPHTQAVFTLTIARAHALAGDRRRTLEAINAAEILNDRAKPGDERPNWSKMRNNAGQFHSHIAKALTDIGDLAGAEHHFHQAWQTRDPRTHTLISGLSQAWLAECQARRGNLAAACANWTEAQVVLDGIASQRAAQCWTDMRALLRPHAQRRIPEVDALLHSAA